MHCSYSRARLDAYVDGSLPRRERARVDAHLARCEECRALLGEFRVIDALLLRPRRLDPAADFTANVMAGVRTVPAPRLHRTPAAAVIVTYVVFAWATIGAFLWWGGDTAKAMLTVLAAGGQQAGVTLAVVASSVANAFGSQTADLTRTLGAILAGDVVLGGFVAAALYAARRPAAAEVRAVDRW